MSRNPKVTTSELVAAANDGYHSHGDQQLTLVISEPPSEDDKRAQEAFRDFPQRVVIHVAHERTLDTPILDAIAVDGGRYRGIRSVLGYIENERKLSYSAEA